MDAWLVRLKGPVIAALVALAGVGLGFLAGRQPAQQALTIATPLPTATIVVTIKVHVSGAVVRPGVYTLRLGDRVEDAIAAAGGATADGNPNALNLAARVIDGQQVLVPKTGEPAPAQSSSPAAPRLISINSATLAELDALPGIGEVYAQKIIDYRNKNGPFQRIEDLVNLKLVPASTFDKIKDLITL